ncbi:hypothetical protein AB6D33_24930 [Vibrio splendidus]
MSQLHRAKRWAIQTLDLLKDNVMLEYGHSDGETIINNYFRLLSAISLSQTQEDLLKLEITETVLLAGS